MSTPVSGLRPAEKRLLVGYGPAVVLGIGFLLMALLVPTIAPEQNVAAAGSAGAATGGGGIQGALGSNSAGGGTNSATGGTNSPTGGASPGGIQSGSASAAEASGGGTAAGAGASGPPPDASACSGRQVPGDPYSPPCVSFSGSNGGATSRGVNSNSIIVSYRIPADNAASVDAAVQQIAGKYNSTEFSDTEADIEQTLGDLVTYFNDHFQFYGRKIVLKQFNGQGQLTEELSDGGQSQADADGLTAADSIGAFADVSALSQPYAEALSAQHIVNIGAPYMSQPWFQQHAPYAYSFFPDCTSLGEEGAAVAVKEIVGANVAFGGTGVSDGQPRRIAVLAPDNPVYQSCAAIVNSALSADHHPSAANLSYTLDFSQLSQEAAGLEQQIVNDKITTIFCGCDPITLIYLTGDLDNARYEPEFVNIGAAFTDEDLLAQLFDQSSWAHAAGETNNGTAPAYGTSLGYFAAKSVDPTHPPAHEVDIIYEDLYILALGVQLAGPDLTPQSFQRGLASYGGGSGEYGPWAFNVNGSGVWTPQHQFRFEWWNPNALSTFDGEKGTWVVGSSWYGPNDVPPGPMPVFPNGPQ
jgi:hypothetical protein